MSTLHHVSGPFRWQAASDSQVQAAVDRCNDLHARAGAAAADALAAAERVANAAAEHAQRRAAALAAGEDDIGRFDPAELEVDASAAAELSEALATGAEMARSEALRVAQEREATWGAAARRRLESTRTRLVKAVAEAEARADEFDAAWTECALASSHEWRDRQKLPRLASRPDGLTWREWASAAPLGDQEREPQGAAEA